MRLLIPAALVLGVGATLVLAEWGWFGRRPLADRLRPYTAAAGPAPTASGLLSVESFREVVGPVAQLIGGSMSRLFGVSEDLSIRLERVHSPLDVTAFRVRQLAFALGAAAVGAVSLMVTHPPPMVGVLLLAGAPLLAFLILEQQAVARSTAWQRRVLLELPIVSEQLAMLVSSGYSLGAALQRVAERGEGACSADLERVTGRVRQGLAEVDALREWASVVAVPAVDRLVPVLALNRDAADLGPLLSEEARHIRRDVQRTLIETMDRRSQSVWIPVTVATLVPGVILLAIPFTQALHQFTAG